MSLDDLLAPLARVPLLAGLQSPQLAEMARHGEKLRYGPGEALTTAGQPVDGAILILSGVVERVIGAQREPLPPGALLAEIAMFVEHTAVATCVAREHVYCLKLQRAAMHAQMLEDPALIEHFQHRVGDRARRLAEELREVDSSLASKTLASAPAPPPPQAAQAGAAARASAPPRFVAAPRAWR